MIDAFSHCRVTSVHGTSLLAILGFVLDKSYTASVSFGAALFIFSKECPGLWQYRLGHSLQQNEKSFMRWKTLKAIFSLHVNKKWYIGTFHRAQTLKLGGVA